MSTVLCVPSSFHCCAGAFVNVFGKDAAQILQVGRHRNRHKRSPDSDHRRLERAERLLRDGGGNFGAKAALPHRLVRDNNPNCLMDYAEILFIKAEAAFHGWIDGSAKEYYEQALTASCQKWAVYGQYAAFPDKDGNTAPVIITSADIQEFQRTRRLRRYAATYRRAEMAVAVLGLRIRDV